MADGAPLRIGLVCEGITDAPVLEAVIEAIIGPDFVPTYLQPEQDQLRGAGDPAGWTEVRRFCQEHAYTLQYRLFGDNVVYVVHIDADRCAVTGAPDNEGLRRVVEGWLGPAAGLDSLVIVTPAQASEAWLYAAHRPCNPQLEQAPDPAELLASVGLIQRDATGKPLKEVAVYRTLAFRLKDQVAALRSCLPELDRFAGLLERFRPASAAPA